MAPIPLLKLGILAINTVIKPVAKAVKSQAKDVPMLRSACLSIGQRMNRLTWHLYMKSQGYTSAKYKIKPLPDEEALRNGSELLGEGIVVAVAAAAILFEYDRQAKKKDAEQTRNALLQEQNDSEYRRRFQNIADNLGNLGNRQKELMEQAGTEFSELQNMLNSCAVSPESGPNTLSLRHWLLQLLRFRVS